MSGVAGPQILPEHMNSDGSMLESSSISLLSGTYVAKRLHPEAPDV